MSDLQRYSLAIDPDDSCYMELDPDGRYMLHEDAERARQAEPVGLREAYERWANASTPPEGRCHCGMPMDAHGGGMTLLHHDYYVIRETAASLPAQAVEPGPLDVERAIYCTGGCDACRDYARELGVPLIVVPPPLSSDKQPKRAG